VQQLSGRPSIWNRPSSARQRTTLPSDTSRRTYVLDTSVLLSDPRAILRFAEHEVVLPVVVITELEGKRHHPEFGYFARRPCACSTTSGSSTAGSTSRCPSGRTAAPCGSSSTTPIPARCRRVPAGRQRHPHPRGGQESRRRGHTTVTIVSKDLPMRVKASPSGWTPQEYRGKQIGESTRAGPAWPSSSHRRAELDELYDDGHRHDEARDLPCHTGLVLHPRAAARWAGSVPTSRSGWCAATGTPSACTAAAPSSASPSTCCSTPTSASSPSAVAPAPASPRWRCVPGSRR
jgi:PhoH-like ATPase